MSSTKRGRTRGLLSPSSKKPTSLNLKCLQETRTVRTGAMSLRGALVTSLPGYLYSLLLVLTCAHYTGAQCPINTMTSFEKIAGVTVSNSILSVLYTAPNVSAEQRFVGAAPGGLSIPITAECNNRCRRSSKCRAFLVDYALHTCYSIEHQASTQSGLVRAPTPIQLVPTQERTAYFEKVCFNMPIQDCERAWVYERVLSYQIIGHDDKLIDDVASRIKCQEYCLNEREFRCRSGEYDKVTMQCRLSMTDRHLKPNSFRPASSNVDYFENQCVPVGNQCDAFDRYEDMDLGRAEVMRSANTSDQCQQFCTQTIKAFVCRSFTWNPLTGNCYLNSANSMMIGGLDRLLSSPGVTYYQRNDCIDLKLECDTSAMTLNLRTNEPFKGRMYVRDDPNSCEVMGRSALSSSLNIPFQPHSRCATKEFPNRYSTVVVVQQHPLIQRKSDRYIKLVCDFQTANKTITSSYNVVANPWTSTALINATSFAPKIKLRITDRFGVDITGAKLGDELYLNIEAESESVYDMVARSVLAKSGTTDESIVLIDKDGCPTDFRIFPPLKKINRRTIVGKFDAFKFSSDVVVRFQVDVQFCLNQCPVTVCDHNLLLNANPASGLQAQSYSVGSLTTAAPDIISVSPSSSLAPVHAGQPLEPTQAPSVPFPLRTSSSDSTRRPTISQPSNSDRNSMGALRDPASYYKSATESSGPESSTSNSQKYPSPPANEPLVNQNDPQTFEHQQRLDTSSGKRVRRHHERRHRRSAEHMPPEPSHVPLQREIIVESLSGSDQTTDRRHTLNLAKQQESSPNRKHLKAVGLVKNGPTYDTGNKADQFPELYNGALLCTTRHSLVLASTVFCIIQILTIAVCLLIWNQRRDIKFKVKHPIEDRLY